MIDAFTLDQCKQDIEILYHKINNLEHAINQAELMIAESKMNAVDLAFIRRKIAYSIQDLEVLYLLKNEHEKNNS